MHIFNSPIGRAAFAEENGAISNFYLGEETLAMRDKIDQKESPLLLEAERQLILYLDGKLKRFDLSLSPQGTLFRQKVWFALQQIPYGETWSYKRLAEHIGRPGAFRAVGGANNKNPIPIVIPCHRVIGTDGSLVGYGLGLELKQKLLDLEKRKAGD
ncbi:MAG: methylated-DNA--[protein]-cysteine S-methyltransferase [Oscillospiraceae bacterium]|jgi:methylated-DNA-[protein]-cysteine S-methyltransferase|nr:methylated-DNA--[protein]-cysteine S-methyltransferase [Oscillospiraceae bacterium]